MQADLCQFLYIYDEDEDQTMLENMVKDNPAFRYIGIVIVVLLCLSIFVDVISFRRLTIYESGDMEGANYNEDAINLTKSIDDVFR